MYLNIKVYKNFELLINIIFKTIIHFSYIRLCLTIK